MPFATSVTTYGVAHFNPSGRRLFFGRAKKEGRGKIGGGRERMEVGAIKRTQIQKEARLVCGRRVRSTFSSFPSPLVLPHIHWKATGGGRGSGGKTFTNTKDDSHGCKLNITLASLHRRIPFSKLGAGERRREPRRRRRRSIKKM